MKRVGLALSLVAYLGASLLDLAEHFRLEREVSGRWIGWRFRSARAACTLAW